MESRGERGMVRFGDEAKHKVQRVDGGRGLYSEGINKMEILGCSLAGGLGTGMPADPSHSALRQTDANNADSPQTRPCVSDASSGFYQTLSLLSTQLLSYSSSPFAVNAFSPDLAPLLLPQFSPTTVATVSIHRLMRSEQRPGGCVGAAC